MALIDEARRRGLIDQIPTSGMRAPAADGSQNNPLNSDLGRNAMNTLAALPGAAGVPGAAAQGAGIAARVLGASAPAATAVGQVAQRAAPYAPVAGGAGALYSASSPASPPVPPAVPTAAAPGTTTSAQPPRTNPFMEAALAGPPMSASGSVTRDGNSYSGEPNISGDITIRNPDGSVRAPGGSVTTVPSGSPRSLIEAAGITLGGGTANAPGYSAPAVRHSGNDWQARNDLRNLQVSASSIMNRPEWNRAGKADVSGDVARYNAAFNDDLAKRGAQPGMDAAAMRENAGLQREGMQQGGANQRSMVQAMLEQQRINQQGEAQGYTNRTNRLVEEARNQVAAEQDPARRRSLVQYMRDIEGRAEPADPYLVVPGGQQIDPTSQRAYNTPASVFNRQTGQFVQQPGQGGVSPIGENQQAIAIRDNPNLSREQKVEALRKLGYS